MDSFSRRGPRVCGDDTRQRVSAAFDHFLDVRGLSSIDIAVDLKGHTLDSRPGIFAEGSAPIQVHYLGYPGSMGVDYMDYVIADRTVIPPDAQNYYLEKIVRLPHSYQPNDSKRKNFREGLHPTGSRAACIRLRILLLQQQLQNFARNL
jgi:protein O-GlcNAc transferase